LPSPCSVGGCTVGSRSPSSAQWAPTPNALLAAFLAETYRIEISFLRRAVVGIPLVILLLPVSWLLLVRLLLPLGRGEIPGVGALIERETKLLGPITQPEVFVVAAFVLTDILWITRPWLVGWVPGLSDAGIALAAALFLFLVPAGWGKSDRVLDWSSASRLPWDVLLMFGGGLSLSAAMSASGLAEWIGGGMAALDGLPTLGVAVAVGVVLVVLSEVASNTAAAVTFMPVVASVAVAMGSSPVPLATIIMMAASGGFVLPAASPPNAIAYGTGRLTMKQLIGCGLVMDLLFALLLPLAAQPLIHIFLPG
jgi:sodium-dependent dicarboxylate transporter 2/3/5